MKDGCSAVSYRQVCAKLGAMTFIMPAEVRRWASHCPKQRNRSRNGHDDRRVASLFRSFVRTPKVRREDRRQLSCIFAGSVSQLNLWWHAGQDTEEQPSPLVAAASAGTGHHVLDFGRARLYSSQLRPRWKSTMAAEAARPPAAGRKQRGNWRRYVA